ncbi:AAA family ATPase [Nocardioides sp. KIGAM211]|uniref:AAA family ATPase n=1 Tax=Nocardioides luti TaxID=2761101 RepID=A0A7X0RJ67_9ACTN|nr:adenylate/guanylate cyclase domain-containing protein [Nocardioides luti]MBB6629328.1 AAA family ATPase [Nocardioides luti]
MARCATCGADLPEVARFCMSCGTAQPEPTEGPRPGARPRPVASRRVTSVLFGDLVGFTSLSEDRDPEEVRELLSRYFEESRRVIERYGGTVEKFIGDAVMAVWGVPTAHEDDAERAVRAGLELVDAVTAFGADVGAEGLAMRVGIVTGEVAVTVGAEHQGMVAGDAVNTAARVQSAAEPGSVWVDETTRSLAAAAISFVDVGTHAMKGKAEPVPLWAVQSVVASVGGLQRVDGLTAPLVGREHELRLVKELFHRCEESGRPSLVVLDGEAGVGKSRLVWELEKYADGLASSVRWHRGRSVAYGEGVAYFALAEAVRGRLLTSLRSDPDRVVGDDDAPGVAELLDQLPRLVGDAEQHAWIRPRLEALLGAGSGATYAREDLFAAWAAFLAHVAGDAPLVLVVEDAHHADEGLLDFVEHLAGVATFGCFVLLVARPALLEGRPGLAAHRRATVVRVDELGADEMGLMLDGLVAGLPGRLRAGLVARAEGLPLFAIETIRSLVDRDVVVPRDGRYVLADPTVDLAELRVPVSLQALLAARLDALGRVERRLVDCASILGDTFTARALRSLWGEEAGFEAGLAELVRLQVVRRDTSPTSADHGNLAFVQSALRRVASGMLSRRDRKALHLAVLAWFDAEGGEVDDFAAIRAQHYLEALHAVPRDPDVADLAAHALEQLRRAAVRARTLGSPGEAVRHLAVALPLAVEPSLRATVGAELARAEYVVGQHDAADAHALEAGAVFAELGDRAGVGLAAACRASALTSRGRNEEAVELAEPLWHELRSHPDAVTARRDLSWALSVALRMLGRDPREVNEEMVRLAEITGDPADLASSYLQLGAEMSSRGLVGPAYLMLERSADIARAGRQPLPLAFALTNLTAGHVTDDLPAALGPGREAHAIAVSTGRQRVIDFCRSNLLLTLWWTGDWDELAVLVAPPAEDEDDLDPRSAGPLEAHLALDDAAEQLAAAARGLAPTPAPDFEDPGDDKSDLAWRACSDAVRASRAGDAATALARAMTAVEVIHEVTGIADDMTHFWPLAARLALETGDGAAVDRLLELLPVQGAGQFPGLMAHRHELLARLGLRDGAPYDEVVAGLRAAVASFETWGAGPARARALGLLGRCLANAGDADGRALLDEARAELTRFGAIAWLAELEEPAGLAR